jgi:acetyltransferase-like isoleucine patch superfamily enzyme
MNLLNKIYNFTLSVLGKAKIGLIKILLQDQFSIGRNAQLKNTARINVWDKEGKILVGDNFSMGYNSELYSWNEQLSIGTNTSLNDNCKIYGNVTIGSNCLLASNIFISSGTHNFSYDPILPIKTQDKSPSIVKSVIIEDDCWLGFGVVIMPGVYVGKGAIIGSNAVVVKDVFPYTINGGVPSRVIGKRLDFSKSFDIINSSIPEHWPFFYKGCNYEQFFDLVSFKNGIEIVEFTSVFLLSKKVSDKLKFSGFCDDDTSFKIFVGKEYFSEVKIERGDFDIEVNLSNQQCEHQQIFDTISNDVKDMFNVIVIQRFDNKSVPFKRGQKTKIRSIGYYDN